MLHIGYPHSGELAAPAKHYANVVADLCWAWLLDPLESWWFLERFVVAAPRSKLMCFGGDYIPVENVVGHAVLARRGLGDALANLIKEGHIGEFQARDLVPALMRTNALALFGRPRSSDEAISSS